MSRIRLYFTEEEKKAAQKRNSLKTRLKNKAKLKARSILVQGQDQIGRLLRVCKQRAQLQHKEFRLTEDDIIIPEVCPYLGCKITNIFGHGKIQTNASIDRKNPKLGYTPDNVQIISHLANRMKQEASREQLLQFAQGILRMYG